MDGRAKEVPAQLKSWEVKWSTGIYCIANQNNDELNYEHISEFEPRETYRVYGQVDRETLPLPLLAARPKHLGKGEELELQALLLERHNSGQYKDLIGLKGTMGQKLRPSHEEHRVNREAMLGALRPAP